MTKRRYAAETEVSVDRSVAEIRDTLKRYGAKEFAHFEAEDGQAAVMFTMQNRRVMFRLTLPAEREFARTEERGLLRKEAARRAAHEQACRSLWRSLALVVKAKLEAVAAGITTFEKEFLGNIVMPGTSIVVGDAVREDLARAYASNEFRPLLPPPSTKD